MEGRPCLCCKIQSTPRQARLQDLCVYCYCSMCSDNPSLCFCSIIFPHHNGNVTHFLLLVVAHSHLHFASSKETRCGVCRLSPTHSSDSAAFQNQTPAFFFSPRSTQTQRHDTFLQKIASIVLKPLWRTLRQKKKKAAVFTLEQYNKAAAAKLVHDVSSEKITKNNCNCSWSEALAYSLVFFQVYYMDIFKT